MGVLHIATLQRLLPTNSVVYKETTDHSLAATSSVRDLIFAQTKGSHNCTCPSGLRRPSTLVTAATLLPLVAGHAHMLQP
jgi:hypothetical protein